jgi:hypothetical protein
LANWIVYKPAKKKKKLDRIQAIYGREYQRMRSLRKEKIFSTHEQEKRKKKESRIDRVMDVKGEQGKAGVACRPCVQLGRHSLITAMKNKVVYTPFGSFWFGASHLMAPSYISSVRWSFSSLLVSN